MINCPELRWPRMRLRIVCFLQVLLLVGMLFENGGCVTAGVAAGVAGAGAVAAAGTADVADSPTERPYQVTSKYAVSDPEFRRTMGNLLGPPFVAGNLTTTLLNGDEIFPAMLTAIRSAHQNINFETYIYWSGKAGADFADALSERAAKGVKVHVIIDSVGS